MGPGSALEGSEPLGQMIVSRFQGSQSFQGARTTQFTHALRG